MVRLLRLHFARAAPAAAGEPVSSARLLWAMPTAIAASLAAHGLMAGVMASHLLSTPEPLLRSSSPVSAARVRGVVTVSLSNRTDLAAPPAPLLNKPPPRAPRKPRAVAAAAAKPAPLATPSPPPTPSPAVAPPVPPLPAPTTQFAGLFAPIIRSPLGRSGWGRTDQSSPPAPPPNAQQQREQAALAWQMAVHGRLTSLAEASRDAARAMSCKVTIDTDQRVGEVECAEAADQAAPWTYLQGVLTAGAVADSTQRLCYTLADRQLFAQACPIDVPTP